MIDTLRPIADAIAARGGRAIVVGGFVRDRLLGLVAKDLDVEVHGLTVAELEAALSGFGAVLTFGRAFGVMQIKGLDIDFSLPRRDSKVGAGHRGFDVEVDPDLGFEEAARRRDLTINSIGFDPLTQEVLDPHGGRRDLEAGILRATDPRHFAEDPLRGLRVAQFAARFEMDPEPGTVALCRALDLSELPGERLKDEFDKLLLKARRPSRGLEVLRATGLLRFFPELEALQGVPQEPDWHPEGDVWIHTCMVVDVAAELRTADPDDDAALMYGALCHDLGKPGTTEVIEGRIRSLAHDTSGVEPTQRFLARLRASNELVTRVVALVRHHLAPALLQKGDATPRAYRRLARKLAESGVSFALLERVARADHWGRTTEEALAREFPAGDAFLGAASGLEIPEDGPSDVVQGRHLVLRGLEPGPDFGPILARCREVQDETGWRDPERILDSVLGEIAGRPARSEPA